MLTLSTYAMVVYHFARHAIPDAECTVPWRRWVC